MQAGSNEGHLPYAHHDLPSLDEYALGYQLGSHWASDRGSWSEIRGLVSHANQMWFHLTLKADHSLLGFLSEEVWDCDPPTRRVKLPREPFIEGVLAAVLSAHDEARISTGAAHRRQ